MATDIENFLNDSKRDQNVREVRKKIDELGIQYIYLQFVSMTGRIMGKGVPARHWEKMCRTGFQLVYGSTANLFIDRHGDYIGYPANAWELVGMPEPETFVQLPWDPRVARVFCTCFRGREHPENPGAYLTSDCRGNLRRLHEQFQQEHDGLHLRAGTEPEMMWLKRDEQGRPGDGYSKPFCYHIDQFESLRPVFLKVIDYCQKMGLDMIQGDHEDAPGQLELNFTFDDVLRNADRLTTYRQICAQVAREFGLIACFMSKPFMSVSASACHTNISLWRGGEDRVEDLTDPIPGMEQPFTYRHGGENAFDPESDNPREPGDVGKHALGGILRHQRGLTVFGAQTVNSYKRLWDTGFWAPLYVNWGYQNRTAAVRNSAPGRFEYKAVDSSHNPYLLGAGLLQAMDDGLKTKADPGPPEQRNIYDHIDEVKSTHETLPMSLGEGLQALEEDEVCKNALPGEAYDVFMHYKRDEWERYLSTVTEWDLENYIDVLP
jgi:glutamine synthetase